MSEAQATATAKVPAATAEPAVAAKVEPAKAPDRKIQLAPNRISLAETGRNIHYAKVEIGTTVNDMLDPAFWALTSAMFSPYDRIEVIADDGTMWAEFIVLACERTYARVKLMRHLPLDTKDIAFTREVATTPQMRESYEIKFFASRKWTVVRLSDQKPISQDHLSRDAAEGWLREYTKTLAVTTQ